MWRRAPPARGGGSGKDIVLEASLATEKGLGIFLSPFLFTIKQNSLFFSPKTPELIILGEAVLLS
jgi:hypothetical protein